MADDESANVGLERAKQSRDRFTEAIDQIRKRADLTAKALGTIGTAALTAIGYAKLADIFPYGGPDWAFVLVIGGAVIMLLAVVFLFVRFGGVGESIITRADVEQTVRASDLSDSEAKLVRETYATTAELNGLDTLRAYEARGQRLETIADRFPEADAKVLKEQAQQIFAEVGATQARAAAFVLRRRSNTASFGIGTGILLFFFVVGWYCVAISADALQSRRADDITVAKNCAEARKEEKIVESELPKICGDPPKETVKKQTTAVEASDQAIESLAKARTTCHIAAAKAGAGEDACAPIDRGLAAAIEAGG